MRNLSVVSDVVHNLIAEKASSYGELVSVTFNQSFSRIYALFRNGSLICYEDLENFRFVYSTVLKFEDVTENWFALDFVVTTSTLVAISEEGSIAVIEEDLSTGEPKEADQVGVIEGGIAAAKWHPDFSSLVIVTRNNSILYMSNSWDVITEIEISPIVPNSAVDLSWKGDGELLSIVTHDQEDNLRRIRVYDSQLLLKGTARHVGEGATAIVKGIGSVVAFASNGSYVAYHQVKPGVGHQIGFLEKNGLSHGSFDLRTPAPVENYSEWTVSAIHGDITSIILAVSWKATSLTNSSEYLGCVQFYYRENYYWYLKQQFQENSLTFLCFDAENTSRCYLKQSSSQLRMVMFQWVVSSSHLRDGTVCMTDGQKLQLTPLGYHSVPPPMSMYQEPLDSFDPIIRQACPRAISFWELFSSNRSKGLSSWGMGILLDHKGSFVLGLGNSKGKLIQKSKLLSIQHFLSQELSQLNEIIFRDLIILPTTTSLNNDVEKEMISLIFIGTSFFHDEMKFSDEDQPNMIWKERHSSSTSTEVINELIFRIDLSLDWNENDEKDSSLSCQFHRLFMIDEIPGMIRHVSKIILPDEIQSNSSLDAFDRLAIGLSNQDTGDYEIIQFALPKQEENNEEDGADGAGGGELFILENYSFFSPQIISTIPELCYSFTVVQHQAKATAPVDGNESLSRQEQAREGGEEEEPAVHATSGALVIALSHKNHLYCNEILLLTNVSSFYYNPSYHLMMCITLGNKPFLHFIMLQSLVHLLQLSSDIEANQEKLITLESCEPRPLERGSKLILSVFNDAKVILQMPRGNLEIIEPRIIIILQVQKLLLQSLATTTATTINNHVPVVGQNGQGQCLLMDCFLLLRKQKIDFNYLFDFYPEIFFQQLESFISNCLEMKMKSETLKSTSTTGHHQNNFAEYLSLLITSIESQDVTKTKYFLFNQLQLNADEILTKKQQFIEANNFLQDNKVNYLCEKIRSILLMKLTDYQSKHSQGVAGYSSQPLHIIHPLLCTYAKQKPPLLQEALTLIKETCLTKQDLLSFGFHSSNTTTTTTTTSTTSITTTSNASENRFYSNHLLMNCIKYLSFLVDGEKLFNSSLSFCDFLMTKLIARQCSMDPKVYIPLIERFESIGKNYPLNSSNFYLMNYKIQIHLKNSWKAIEFFLLLIQQLFHEQITIHNNDSNENHHHHHISLILSQIEKEILSEVCEMIQQENFYQILLTKLIPLEREILLHPSYGVYQSTVSSVYQLILSFVNKIRLAYANQCCSEMNYSTAIHYFLSMNPPMVNKAIDTALSQSDWQQALLIAGRYPNLSSQTPKKLAQEIVYNFQQNQEYFTLHISSSTNSSSSPFAQDFQHHGDYFTTKYLTSDNNTNWKATQFTNRLSSYDKFSLLSTAHASNLLGKKNSNGASIGGNNGETENADKSLLAAKISVEYCEDVETAVNILTNAHHWNAAISMAIQYHRLDLLDEIFSAGRVAAKEMLEFLDGKSTRLPEIIKELNEFWKNAEERIRMIAQEDSLLQKELRNEEYQEDEFAEGKEPGGGNDWNQGDTSSEYSAITKYSLQSFRSGQSRSAKSLISSHSLGGHSSIISGNNSSVTILSQLSSASSSSSSQKNYGDDKESSFAIQGLDHSLLSRGKADEQQQDSWSSTGGDGGKRDLKPRHQKRIEKQKAKGTYYDRTEAGVDSEGNPIIKGNTKEAIQKRKERHQQKRNEMPKDLFELKKENSLCEELLSYVHLKPLLAMIIELKQLLTMSYHQQQQQQQVTQQDRLLLLELMEKEQQFIECLQKQQLVYAPNYPLIWLLKKNFKSLLYFQNYQYFFNKKIFKQLQFFKSTNPTQYNQLLTVTQALGIGIGNNAAAGTTGSNNVTTAPPTTSAAANNATGFVLTENYQLLMMLNLLSQEELQEFTLLSKNWWNLCYEGIQFYYQSSKLIHFQPQSEI